jgi:hypothetical protein
MTIKKGESKMSGLVFKVVVIEQVTERVWYEVTGVASKEEALAAYQAGEGTETYRKHLATNRTQVEEVYQEKPDAQSMAST